MSDDRFEERAAPAPRRVREIAQTVFDRTQKEKFDNVVEVTFGFCSACSNSGIEQYKDADGYNVARRCTRCAKGAEQ